MRGLVPALWRLSGSIGFFFRCLGAFLHNAHGKEQLFVDALAADAVFLAICSDCIPAPAACQTIRLADIIAFFYKRLLHQLIGCGVRHPQRIKNTVIDRISFRQPSCFAVTANRSARRISDIAVRLADIITGIFQCCLQIADRVRIGVLIRFRCRLLLLIGAALHGLPAQQLHCI